MRTGEPRAERSAAGFRQRWHLLVPIAILVAIVLIGGVIGTDSTGAAALMLATLGAFQVVSFAFAVRSANHPALSPSTRRAWRFLAAAFALQLLADVGFTFAAASEADHLTPALTTGLISRLLALPAFLAGLLELARRPLSRRDRWKLAMDVAMVVGAAVMLLWYLAIGPALDTVTASNAARLATVVFTLGDIMLIVGLVVVLLRGTNTDARGPGVLLLVGSVTLLAADLALFLVAIERAAIVVIDDFWLNVGLCVPQVFFATAAIDQIRHASTQDRWAPPRPMRTPGWLPYVATGVGLVILVVASSQDNPYPWSGLVAGFALITIGSTVRQFLAVRESRRMAVTDTLTGLANRAKVSRILAEAADRSRRTGTAMAVLQIDLVGFKHINDTFGHAMGDQLLQAFADVLRRNTRESDTVGRVGGDEFAIVLSGADAGEQAVATAERILADAGRPTTVGAGRMPMRASIGIATAGPYDELVVADPELLIHQADAAMYAAKRHSGHGLRVYAASPAVRPVHEGAADEMELVYAPVYDLDGGELVAVEAQVRGERIPLTDVGDASDANFSDEIGWQALDRACADVAAWPTRRPLDLNIRVSPHQLVSASAAAGVRTILRRTGFEPEHLVLEIGESRMAPAEAIVGQLHDLRAVGIRIALDGFGAGHASLRHLGNIPINILKLDPSFVDNIDGSAEGSAVAAAVMHLADLLQLDTIADGVTTARQRTELSALGYDRAQGPFFSPLLTADQMAALIGSRGNGAVRPDRHLWEPDARPHDS